MGIDKLKRINNEKQLPVRNNTTTNLYSRRSNLLVFFGMLSEAKQNTKKIPRRRRGSWGYYKSPCALVIKGSVSFHRRRLKYRAHLQTCGSVPQLSRLTQQWQLFVRPVSVSLCLSLSLSLSVCLCHCLCLSLSLPSYPPPPSF